MPRGRPRKVILEDNYSSIELVVADYLAHHCNVPGCKADWHADDARELIKLLEARGFKGSSKVSGDSNF